LRRVIATNASIPNGINGDAATNKLKINSAIAVRLASDCTVMVRHANVLPEKALTSAPKAANGPKT